MIERLKVKKDMKGESVSDSEIQELASQVTATSMSAKAPVNKGKIESPGLGDAASVSEPVKKQSQPKKVEAKPAKKKTYKPKNDSIESLEEELLQ